MSRDVPMPGCSPHSYGTVSVSLALAASLISIRCRRLSLSILTLLNRLHLTLVTSPLRRALLLWTSAFHKNNPTTSNTLLPAWKYSSKANPPANAAPCDQYDLINSIAIASVYNQYKKARKPTIAHRRQLVSQSKLIYSNNSFMSLSSKCRP